MNGLENYNPSIADLKLKSLEMGLKVEFIIEERKQFLDRKLVQLGDLILLLDNAMFTFPKSLETLKSTLTGYSNIDTHLLLLYSYHNCKFVQHTQNRSFQNITKEYSLFEISSVNFRFKNPFVINNLSFFVESCSVEEQRRIEFLNNVSDGRIEHLRQEMLTILKGDIFKEINHIQQQIQKLTSYNFLDVCESVGRRTNYHKDTIIEIPIADILGRPKRKSGKIWWYCSPIRKLEKSPSFAYYLNTNSWYDYGIGKGGNVIDLYMEMHNISFIDAMSGLSQQLLDK